MQKNFLSPKGNWSRLVSANSRARKGLGISLSRQLTARKSAASLQHSKVIRSPQGSVNCFSRREAADGEGSEDPDAPPTPLSDVQIVSPSALFSFLAYRRGLLSSMTTAPEEIIVVRAPGSWEDNPKLARSPSWDIPNEFWWQSRERGKKFFEATRADFADVGSFSYTANDI